MAFASLGFSGLMMLYVLHSLIVYQTAPGWASVVLAISLFSGVQLLTLGILGEYIGRLYVEAKGRPLYFVAEDTREQVQIAEHVAIRKLSSV
jgi:polyisoprenyl-phosphate glycosyltransferase